MKILTKGKEKDHRYCRKCNAAVNYGDVYCEKCGGRLEKYQVGDTIYFGKYEGMVLEWIVLDVREEDQRMLLLSKYGIEMRKYNEELVDITWEECTLRKYLQTEFLLNKNRFTEEERKRIRSVYNHNGDNGKVSGGNHTWDRLFLLSIEEYKRYLDKGILSKYVVCRSLSDGESEWWWLRSPGAFSNLASYVNYAGGLGTNGHFVRDDCVCVRPAFWYNL